MKLKFNKKMFFVAALLLVLFILFFSYCCEFKIKLIEPYFKTLNRESFYKGGLGTIYPGLYIKRKDKYNIIYSGDDIAYKGGQATSFQLIQVKVNSDHIKFLNRDKLSHSDINVIFSKSWIYIMDYNKNEFAKYKRNN